MDRNFYKEFPKTCAPDDFWGQVRRTHNGKPIGEDQIEMIVSAMIDAMGLQDTDKLLDLCCGNGALSDRWLRRCSGGTGVDFSEALLQVAKANFLRPEVEYVLSPVEEFVQTCEHPDSFSVAICYGSWQYIPVDLTIPILRALRQRFSKLRRFVIGNLPNKDTAPDFFARRGITDYRLDDPGSAVGAWTSPEEMTNLGAQTGWTVEIRRMPQDFYAGPFRFDAVLHSGKDE